MIWGVSFLFGKIALREMPASHLVLGRFLIASILLFPTLWRFWSSFRWSDFFPFVAAGILMVPMMMLLQFGGLALTSATSAALIVGTLPVMMAIGGMIFDGDRLGSKGWVAVGLSTAGAVALVGTPAAGRSLLGDMLVFLSTIASMLWVILSRRLLQRYEALPATAFMIILGTIVLAPISIWMDGIPTLDYNALTWSSLGVLGAGCTALTYSLWNWGIQRVSASRAGVFVNFEPLVGAILGIMVLGEPFNIATLFGGALILLAAIITTLQPEMTQPVEVA